MIAYDVGMHNGDDTAYYLAKGFRVVAVEANPAFIAAGRERFADECASGQVVIEGCGIADAPGTLTFYVNPINTLQSSFVPPEEHAWEPVEVPTTRLSTLIDKHGAPDFLKIDIEHMDLEALGDLQEHDILPRYISAEAHSFDVLMELYGMGYRRFRLINGKTIARTFGRMHVRTLTGQDVSHTFPKNCSGPYGNDIRAPWMGFEGLCQTWVSRLVLLGRGWYDVHASLPAEHDGMFLG